MMGTARSAPFAHPTRSSDHPGMTVSLSFLDERAFALLDRNRGVFRRDGGDELVIVPRIFRFIRLLHLEQIGRNDAAAVGAKRALAEQRIVGRDLLHLGDDL